MGLYVGNLQHLFSTKRAMNSRVGVNMRYLGAVGWQPTALIFNKAGYEQQGWGRHEVSWGCGLATYSTYWQQYRL